MSDLGKNMDRIGPRQKYVPHNNLLWPAKDKSRFDDPGFHPYWSSGDRKQVGPREPEHPNSLIKVSRPAYYRMMEGVKWLGEGLGYIVDTLKKI